MNQRQCGRPRPLVDAPSEQELLRLARAFAAARGRDPSMDELRQLDEWATRTRLNGALLEMVLKGLALIDLADDGTPAFQVAGGAEL